MQIEYILGGVTVIGAVGILLGHRLRSRAVMDAAADDIEYQTIRFMGSKRSTVDLENPTQVRRLAALAVSILPEDSWQVEVSSMDDDGRIYWTTHRLDKEELLDKILPGWYEL